jgi:REP-associated tyrosine transposase
MSRTIHRLKQAGIYFITTDTWERRPIFLKAAPAELLVDQILDCRSRGFYSLHAFVVMPDHLHILLTPSGTASLERAMQMIKGGSAFRIRKELNYSFPIWHPGYHDHWIRDAAEFEVRKQYLDTNPVKARLARFPAEYQWSSASGKFPLDSTHDEVEPSAAKAGSLPDPMSRLKP